MLDRDRWQRADRIPRRRVPDSPGRARFGRAFLASRRFCARPVAGSLGQPLVGDRSRVRHEPTPTPVPPSRAALPSGTPGTGGQQRQQHLRRLAASASGLGLGAGHIDMIDLKAGDMHHLHLTGAQSQRDVRSITEAADGFLWVGSQGLARIDPNSLAISDVSLPALDKKPVLTMAPDGDQSSLAHMTASIGTTSSRMHSSMPAMTRTNRTALGAIPSDTSPTSATNGGMARPAASAWPMASHCHRASRTCVTATVTRPACPRNTSARSTVTRSRASGSVPSVA